MNCEFSSLRASAAINALARATRMKADSAEEV
jgi:hypothetical protein